MLRMKGRNGYFKLDHFTVFGSMDGEGLTIADFYSRTRGNSPPVVIQGTGAEMEKFFSKVLQMIKRERQSKGLIYNLRADLADLSPMEEKE
jgi:hypothetical protein